MKRFDSIYLRVVAVLLLGLLAAQWVSERLYEEERTRMQSHLVAGPLGRRLATVADKLDRTPAAERGDLLKVLSSTRLLFKLVPKPLSGSPPASLALLQSRLQTTLGPDRHVVVAGPAADYASGKPEDVRISFVLRDGQAVVATHQYPNGDTFGPSRHLPLLTGYFLAITLLAMLALRWAVRPLQVLAQAANTLGRDLSGAPLDETGPREVRQAARAFNTMQNRLASYLDDRLHILAAVSHDLKSPITRLKLRTEMLADPGLREKFRHDLEDMETMIGATLDFLHGESRQESSVQIDINALLSTLRDDLSGLGYGIELKGKADEPLLARPQALKRCLSNLLDNAVRYGTRARITVDDGAETLRLLIDDDGPGIPERDMEQMFEPFRRGEASRNRATGGVGLGLAIARNLARAHGGDITLANRPEGGLRATLSLPRGRLS